MSVFFLMGLYYFVFQKGGSSETGQDFGRTVVVTLQPECPQQKLVDFQVLRLEDLGYTEERIQKIIWKGYIRDFHRNMEIAKEAEDAESMLLFLDSAMKILEMANEFAAKIKEGGIK